MSHSNAAALARILDKETYDEVSIAGEAIRLDPACGAIYQEIQELLLQGDRGTEVILRAVEETTGLDRPQTLDLLRLATAEGSHNTLIETAYTLVGMPPKRAGPPPVGKVVADLRKAIASACSNKQVPNLIAEVLDHFQDLYPEPETERDEAGADEVF